MKKKILLGCIEARQIVCECSKLDQEHACGLLLPTRWLKFPAERARDIKKSERHSCFFNLHDVTVQGPAKEEAVALGGDALVLACPSLALVAFALLHNVLVWVALCTSLVTTLGWSAPDRDGVDVTL